MKATVTEIKRFAIHDGDGIRTTVFLKGCPLRCVWCHNPEGLVKNRQLAFFEHKCLSCRACGEVCPNHKFSDQAHEFLRNDCIACGKCAEVCPVDALKLYGTEMTADEVLKIVLEDKAFYDTSGGGLTISGGECLTYPDFCVELLKKAKDSGINTAVDTCGFVSRETLDKVMPYTDVFLYDVKAVDEDVHIRCTGVSNKPILENLRYLDECGCKTEIRSPRVPEWNYDQKEKIEQFVASLKNVSKLVFLEYNPLAESKYAALGLKYTKITEKR